MEGRGRAGGAVEGCAAVRVSVSVADAGRDLLRVIISVRWTAGFLLSWWVTDYAVDGN